MKSVRQIKIFTESLKVKVNAPTERVVTLVMIYQKFMRIENKDHVRIYI